MSTRAFAGLPPGRVRPMTRWGERVMHTPAARVTTFDAELAELVADMVATMVAADGVGLAAPQIGVGLAVFVYDVRARTGEAADEADAADADRTTVASMPGQPAVALGPFAGVVCNPRLTLPTDDPAQERVKDSEGCLSLPGTFAPCVRSWVASVTGVDHRGQPVFVSGTGLLARCLQHESDHLDGIVFGDRLPGRRRRRLLGEAEDVAADYPADWPVSPVRSAH